MSPPEHQGGLVKKNRKSCSSSWRKSLKCTWRNCKLFPPPDSSGAFVTPPILTLFLSWRFNFQLICFSIKPFTFACCLGWTSENTLLVEKCQLKSILNFCLIPIASKPLLRGWLSCRNSAVRWGFIIMITRIKLQQCWFWRWSCWCLASLVHDPWCCHEIDLENVDEHWNLRGRKPSPYCCPFPRNRDAPWNHFHTNIFDWSSSYSSSPNKNIKHNDLWALPAPRSSCSAMVHAPTIQVLGVIIIIVSMAVWRWCAE